MNDIPNTELLPRAQPVAPPSHIGAAPSDERPFYPRPKKYWRIVAGTRKELARRFPSCFVPQGGTKRPLAVDIHIDLAFRAPDIPASDIHWCLRRYTTSKGYFAACTPQAIRVDLDGNPKGIVTAYLAKKFARRLKARTWREAREAAKRQPQANVAGPAP